jgi:hypothetical protein
MLATVVALYNSRRADEFRHKKERVKMVAMPRLRLLGMIVIGSALAALLALVAFSPAARANHSWNGFHWARQSNPFTLKLGDNVSSKWNPYLGTASSDWSKSRVLDTRIVAGQANPDTCRPTSGRVEVCNSAYGNNGWLGIAQVWVSGKHITQATTKMNGTYFSTPKYDTPARRQLVMCQELGHTFGLAHQDEVSNNPNLGTCMDYTNDPNGGVGGASATDPSNKHPNRHDYNQLALIYSHLDGRTTVSSTSAASTMLPSARRGDLNSRAEWGRQIRESGNGKLEVWVHRYGEGNKMFTFVIEA